MEVTLEDLSIKVENLSLAIDMLGLNLSAIQNQHLENALVLHTMSSKVNKMYEWMEKSHNFRSSIVEKVVATASSSSSSAVAPDTSSLIMEEPDTKELVNAFNKLDVEKDVDETEDIFMKLLNRFPVRISVPPPIHPLKNYDCPLD